MEQLIIVMQDPRRSRNAMIDAASYRTQRMAHWNRTAARKNNPERSGAFYQQLLEHYYGMMVQPGLRILELGCGGGDLLAALEPSFGVGVDFSSEMLDIARSKHPNVNLSRQMFMSPGSEGWKPASLLMLLFYQISSMICGMCRRFL